jgi:lipopolysaccharide/colanic/teichoic acid biosynthesis glycosyltransferase
MLIKTFFDFTLSFLGLIFLFPLFVFIAIWIKIDSDGPIFFRQERIGRFGKPFKIHKFRTMRVDSGNASNLTVGRDNRITHAGYFLRKFKLDELPQLIDVLQGNMSLVGPRPEVREFVEHYPKQQREKIFSIRPGITDLASIEMINESDLLATFQNPKQAYLEKLLPLKISYYVDYAENRTLWLDFKIIYATIVKILSKST